MRATKVLHIMSGMQHFPLERGVKIGRLYNQQDSRYI